jgi:hypothetical protein
MTTAARFNAGPDRLSGSRANAAQRSAIFCRVGSPNGHIIPLDYTTAAIDEMTAEPSFEPEPETVDMTDKSAEKLKASGWTIAAAWCRAAF